MFCGSLLLAGRGVGPNSDLCCSRGGNKEATWDFCIWPVAAKINLTSLIIPQCWHLDGIKERSTTSTDSLLAAPGPLFNDLSPKGAFSSCLRALLCSVVLLCGLVLKIPDFADVYNNFAVNSFDI